MIRAAIFIFCIVLIYLNCTMPLAGNSSETSNGVTITAMKGRIEGKAPANSKVCIYNNRYNPVIDTVKGLVDSTISDPSGYFSFDVNSNGYGILFKNTEGLLAFSRIEIDTNTIKKDTITDTLKIPGALRGSSNTYKETDSLYSYVFIYGSPFKALVDENGNCIFTDLPAGQYSLSFLRTNKICSYDTTTSQVPVDFVVLDTSTNVNEITVIPGTTGQFNF